VLRVGVGDRGAPRADILIDAAEAVAADVVACSGLASGEEEAGLDQAAQVASGCGGFDVGVVLVLGAADAEAERGVVEGGHGSRWEALVVGECFERVPEFGGLFDAP